MFSCVKQVTEDRLVELLNSKCDGSFNLLRFDELPLETKLRVHSLRSKKTQYGFKLLAELDTGSVFLPTRYSDLFLNSKSDSENFFMKTSTTFMTITGFRQEIIIPDSDTEEEVTYNTPILQFHNESSTTPLGDRKRKASGFRSNGNTSMDVLTKAAAVFAEADNATGGKLPAFSTVLKPSELEHVKRVLDFGNNGETANTADDQPHASQYPAMQ